MQRHLLKFSSGCSLDEFRARCQENDFWYHSYYFDNGFIQKGDYDIGLNIADYQFPADMSGMSVLDIGTGGGWFSTYFEQQGADVVATDVRGWCDYDIFGRDGYPEISSEKTKPDRISSDGRPVYFSPTSKGFWIMKDMLNLKAEFVNARAYDIKPELFGCRKFDVVFLGSVLMHLRDPIGALRAAHSVCRGRFIATTHLLPEDFSSDPVMRIWEGGEKHGISWWTPNRLCLIQWLKAAGFTSFNIEDTVRLTTDNPYRDQSGIIAASDQTHQLIQADIMP